MDDSIGIVPIDKPSRNPDVQDQRERAKDSLWRIDKAIDEGQIVPNEDDGKQNEGGIIIPDGRNSV